MMQLLTDVLGYIVTGISIISVQFKKKWQILFGSFLANFIAVISLLIQSGVTSAVMVNCVGGLQCGINAILSYKGKSASKLQMGVFFVLFFVAGVIRYEELLDILPIMGSMLFMVSKFQKTEQKIRIYGVFSCLVWVFYYIIIRSTIIYGQIFSLVSTFIALYRYRKS